MERAATLFRLQIKFKEKTRGLFPCPRFRNAAKGLNFDRFRIEALRSL